MFSLRSLTFLLFLCCRGLFHWRRHCGIIQRQFVQFVWQHVHEADSPGTITSKHSRLWAVRLVLFNVWQARAEAS